MARNSGWPTIANERSIMQLRDDLVLPGRVMGRLKDGEPVLLERIPPRARSERSRGAFGFTAMWGSAAVACSARAAGPTRRRGPGHGYREVHCPRDCQQNNSPVGEGKGGISFRLGSWFWMTPPRRPYADCLVQGHCGSLTGRIQIWSSLMEVIMVEFGPGAP